MDLEREMKKEQTGGVDRKRETMVDNICR